MGFILKYQRILIVVGFIAAVVFFGYLIYYFFFRPMLTEQGVPGETSTSTTEYGRLPVAETGPGQLVDTEEPAGLETEAGEGRRLEEIPNEKASGGLTKTEALIDTPSLSPTLGSDGKSLQYYNQEDGKFYKIDNNGQIVPLSDKAFYEVQNVTWAPQKSKAILEYPDGSNIIYDFDSAKQITMPAHWQEFSFSPSGEKIAAKSLGKDENNRFLMVANSDGTKAKIIEELGANEEYLDVAWSPNNQVVATFREGISMDQQEVYLIGQNQENFKSLVVDGRGFEYIWAPDGKRILYSVYSTDTALKPMLWTVNATGELVGTGRKSLNLETWATKCAFSDDITVYCAVPAEMPEGSGLFRELAENTTDEIFMVDLSTGMKKLIAIPDGNYTIEQLMVSDNGRYLYFNDAEGKLRKINLY